MDLLQSFLVLLSRICICSIYLWAAWAKISDWRGTIAYMESKTFPWISLMLPAAIILQIIGGLSLLLGIYCRLGAIILIIFTIPAMIKMHNFWQVDGTMRTIEKTLFMKDVAIVGGLLAISILGPGIFSFDALWATDCANFPRLCEKCGLDAKVGDPQKLSASSAKQERLANLRD